MSNESKRCKVHYTGTFNDGTKFDSSYDRGEPLEFVCGAGQMIKGFDAAVANMEVGQVVDVHLMPEEAYGMPNPDAIFTLEIEQLPGSEDLTVGQQVYLCKTKLKFKDGDFVNASVPNLNPFTVTSIRIHQHPNSQSIYYRLDGLQKSIREDQIFESIEAAKKFCHEQ